MAADKKKHKKDNGDKSRQKKASKKSADKSATSKTAKKITASEKRKAVMAQFKNARISDVSDKVFVADSVLHGKGLFASQRIKADTVLGRLVGMPTFDDGIYVLWITDDLGLELVNDFKYINHGKKPNAAYTDEDVTILRDVEAGEELLHDYGW